MKIFLAGATGVIGSLLLPMLVKAGHQVTGTTRSAAKFDYITARGGHPVILDALDRKALFAVMEAERPDVVFHLLTDLRGRDFAANSQLRIEGTRNLVDAALAVGVQRMIAESIAWIYVPGSGPAEETEPLDLTAPPPRGSTVAAVQSMEQAVSEMPVGVILRYGILYGEDTWYSRSGLTTQQIMNGELTATDGITSFVHVFDAARAAFLALDYSAGPLNVVDDAPASGKKWIPLYASLVGAPPPPISDSNLPWERGASNRKMRQLGWVPSFPIWREGFQAVLGEPSK